MCASFVRSGQRTIEPARPAFRSPAHPMPVRRLHPTSSYGSARPKQALSTPRARGQATDIDGRLPTLATPDELIQVKAEVKAAAYLQAWDQRGPSRIAGLLAAL